MLRLFLSYAREDVDRVRRFAAELRRTGIEPWMDDELKLAGRWNTEIEDRIAACDLFLAIQSRATQEGDATRFFCKEWRLAHKARRCFLPVRLEECRLPASLPKTLATAIESYKHEDLFPTYEVGLRRILRCLYDKKRTGVFEETFSCLGPDNAGWRLGGWQLDRTGRTGENSCSLHAVARLSITQPLPQVASQTAAIDLELPGRPLLVRYRRRLRLSAPAGGAAGFRVLVDGEVIDMACQGDSAEHEWTTRAVPVPDRGTRWTTLEFTVSASGNLNFFPSAEAWVKDLHIA